MSYHFINLAGIALLKKMTKRKVIALSLWKNVINSAGFQVTKLKG